VKQKGKSLKAVVITHPHPDHYNGTCRLLQLAKVPVYPTQATIDDIHATAEAKRTQWKPTCGKGYPDSTCVPDHVLPDNGTVQIDGLKFQSKNYGPGEALTETILLALSLHAAFVGDLIYNQVHPWLPEGR
jgi:glyoxylase-like metal-dependent hydrolase (beta-lactamase superfamily II)